MDVKGTAYLTRAQQIAKQFGEKAWEQFLADFAKKEPFFQQTIVATSQIPVEKLLKLNDAVLEKFYRGDKQVYWVMGEQGAAWALTEGPYAIYAKKDLKGFVEKSLAKLWSTYFTGGTLAIKFEDDRIVDVRIGALPLAHVYFEYLVMGYAKKSFELLGVKNVKMDRLKGFDSPDREIHYRFELNR